MKGAVIFRSRYGVTRQYATWIAEDTGFDLKDIDKDSIDLSLYDRVIIGASIRAGKFINSGWIHKHRDELQSKELIIFSVGGYPPSAEDKIEKAKKNSIPEGLNYRYFALQGKISMDMLKWWERAAFSIISKLDKKNDEIGNIVKGFDFVKRENIKPVVESALSE